MNDTAPSHLRVPDFHIAGLRLWIDGYHYEASTDYWDGNWMRVRAEYQSTHSRVVVEGPIVHLSELTTLRSGCEKLVARKVEEAGLYCMEPNLKIELWAVPNGQVIGKVRITPDHKSEMHDFGFALDEAELSELLASCVRVLEKFPLRHSPSTEKSEH